MQPHFLHPLRDTCYYFGNSTNLGCNQTVQYCKPYVQAAEIGIYTFCLGYTVLKVCMFWDKCKNSCRKKERLISKEQNLLIDRHLGHIKISLKKDLMNDQSVDLLRNSEDQGLIDDHPVTLLRDDEDRGKIKERSMNALDKDLNPLPTKMKVIKPLKVLDASALLILSLFLGIVSTAINSSMDKETCDYLSQLISNYCLESV